MNSVPYLEKCRRIFNNFEDEDYFGPKAHHIYFYGNVTEENVHNFRVNIQKVVEIINSKKSKSKNIVIHIHSPGGIAELGVTLVSIIREIYFPVAVIVDGYACSAITPMLVSAPYRVMHDFSFALIHEMKVSMSQSKIQDAQFLIDKYMYQLESDYRDIYKNNTNIPIKVLNDLMNRDKFINAEMCKKWNVVDHVIKLNKRQNMYKTSVQKPLRNSQSKHIFHYNNVPKLEETNTDYVYNNKVSKSVLNIVEELQDIINKPKLYNTILHTNKYLLPTESWFDIAPLMVRIISIKKRKPITSIIDSNIDIIKAIPCILSSKRYMYRNTNITVRLMFTHNGLDNKYYHDIKSNTDLIRTTLTKLLKQYTKLPKAILDDMFDKRILLSADECLKYGIIDEIIEPYMR